MKKLFSCYSTIIIICLTGCSNISDGLQHTSVHIPADILYEYSITINNFSDVTYERDVIITVNPGEASAMRFSNDQVNWSEWESTSSTVREWILSERSSVKTVYAEFRRDGLMINYASDDIEFIEKLLPGSSMNFDKFGTSVDISADGFTAIMGAEDYSYTNASGFTYKSGCAIIYKYDGVRWNPALPLLVPGGASGFDKFGASVSISGDGNTAIVGSPGFKGNNGRVLLYRYDISAGAWIFITSITGASGSYFGNSVALSKDGLYAACAAVYGNSRKGEVLLYSVSPSALNLRRTLRADDGLAEDRFGCSVSINNDASVIVAGADHRKVGEYTNSGCVYVFRKSGSDYVQVSAPCSAPDYNMYSGCSTSVSADGKIICAGAKGYSEGRGCLLVFNFDSGSGQYIQQGIIANEGEAGEQLGYSVDMSGDGSIILAGSPYADSGITDSGKLSRYTLNGGGYIKNGEYCPTDPVYQKHLGVSAAMDDEGAVFIGGAIKDIYNNYECGTTYVFRN